MVKGLIVSLSSKSSIFIGFNESIFDLPKVTSSIEGIENFMLNFCKLLRISFLRSCKSEE